MEELIPAVEEHFRVIRQSYARVLASGSTGGFGSLALQVYHPVFFGGAWFSRPPDPVDLRRYYGAWISTRMTMPSPATPAASFTRSATAVRATG